MIKYYRGKMYFTGSDYVKIKEESRRLHKTLTQTVHILLWNGLKFRYPEVYAKIKRQNKKRLVTP